MKSEVKNVIRRELVIQRPVGEVWRAITDREVLAEWMFPNDFEARVGHRFTFEVPGRPEVKFEGLTVRCEVLECEERRRLVFSWSAGGGAVENTRVSFRLEAEGKETRVFFEHSGFDLDQPMGMQAMKGAEYGWGGMFEALVEILEGNVR